MKKSPGFAGAFLFSCFGHLRGVVAETVNVMIVAIYGA